MVQIFRRRLNKSKSLINLRDCFKCNEMNELPKNNELVHMTRRYPKLRKKVLQRDSKIVMKLMRAWDVEQDENKVLSIYLKEKDSLSHERYWELMRTVWVVCGSVDRAELFRHLMQSWRPQKHYFSTPEEATRLRQMPDNIVVYRATNDENDLGLSWTISEQYAQEYKEMYQKKMIIEKTISKSDVFAFIERNNEHELILL